MQSSHFALGPCLGVSEDMRRQRARGFVELQDQLAIAIFLEMETIQTMILVLNLTSINYRLE